MLDDRTIESPFPEKSNSFSCKNILIIPAIQHGCHHVSVKNLYTVYGGAGEIFGTRNVLKRNNGDFGI
jgi:hypothetical protein